MVGVCYIYVSGLRGSRLGPHKVHFIENYGIGVVSPLFRAAAFDENTTQ